jgi:hypothetical protein
MVSAELAVPSARLSTVRRVLVLGWWQDVAAVLDRYGCEVTFAMSGADVAEANRGGFTGTVVPVGDPTKVDDVLAGLARQDLQPQEFDVICSEHEPCIVPAAILATVADRPGMSVGSALALRDKFVQKAAVREAGVAVAGCRVVPDAEGLAEVPLPFVVKPTAGSCTQFTYPVHDESDRAWVRRTLATVPGPWLVEEFITGGELHLDGVVRGGDVLFLSVSRYLDNVIDIRLGGLVGSVILDPVRYRELYREARELMTGSLRAIGHRDGVFHAEAFEQADRLVFSECAGRIGGGMVLDSIRAKFGVDLYDEWARSVLAQPSGLSSTALHVDPRPFGWVHLLAPAGLATSVPSTEDLCRRPDVVVGEAILKPGDTVPDSKSASNIRAGRVTMTGTDEEGCAANLRALVDWFHGQVVVS